MNTTREEVRSLKTVWIPGMFCGTWAMNDFAAYFAGQGYESMILELPYHEKKEGDPRLGKLNFGHYVKSLAERLLDIEGDYVLGGHSMGGLLAMVLAMHKKINPKLLILLAPAAPWGIFKLTPSVIKCFEDVLLTPKFWSVAHRLSREKVNYAMFNQMPKEMTTKLHQKFVWESGRVITNISFMFLDPWRHTAVSPRKINCPIVVYQGDRDNIVPLSVTGKVVKKLDYRPGRIFRILKFSQKDRLIAISGKPPVEFKVLPGRGHWLHQEEFWEDEIAIPILERIKEIEKKM